MIGYPFRAAYIYEWGGSLEFRTLDVPTSISRPSPPPLIPPPSTRVLTAA